MKFRIFTPLVAAASLLFSASTLAEDYVIDTKGMHAFIQFKVSHLGFGYVLGQFNNFTGKFSYDENDPSKSSVEVEIDTTSVDSNHAERDKHIRSEDFLVVSEHPTAKFVSTSYQDLGDGKGKLMGDLTLMGKTLPLTIDVTHIGAGKDPWGGFRRGFAGTTKFKMADFGVKHGIGAQDVELNLVVEGIRL